ncbi:MAG: glycine--tRNA ligase subunit beta [Negativicutes bacterium]
MPQDILLEIGTEEIPAKFMPGALEQLGAIAREKFAAHRIAYQKIETMGTPRRMTLIVRQAADFQSDKRSENKGPAVKIAYDADGNPTKAAQGFARGQGVEAAQLIVKDGYVYALVEEIGREVRTLLPELLGDLIHALNFPKTMHWANLDMRFVRPIRWLLALYGTEIIPFTVATVSSANTTCGHRFLGQNDITVTGVEDYIEKLRTNSVIVDQTERRQMIREQIEKLAEEQGGAADIDADLLEEVVHLVEYPTALCGRFEEQYLALPKEAIITPMREHQRYFPVLNENGALLPLFITVRNGGSEHLDIVRHGNERVLRARLADARFFFEEDRKLPLASRVDKLKTIVFQEGLGTLYDKTVRLQWMAEMVAFEAGEDKKVLPVIKRAAHLAKADLVTGMVCEFTELQGVMGREYALCDGENAAVAEAIFEHYLPRFAGDVLPGTAAGRIIGIADKLDNITATISRGLMPTGSQDPYALRRQALGIINILISAGYYVSLSALINQMIDLLGIKETDRKEKLLVDILDFFRLRIKNVLAEHNVRYDIVDAVMSAGSDDPLDTWQRAAAMSSEAGQQATEKAVRAFTRAGNLAKNCTAEKIEPSLFAVEAEHALYNAYCAANASIHARLASHDYVAILQDMAELAAPIDLFFTSVMVMVEDVDVRNNRLALLKAITNLAVQTADFSKIVTV